MSRRGRWYWAQIALAVAVTVAGVAYLWPDSTENLRELRDAALALFGR